MKTKVNLKRLLVITGMFVVFVFSSKAENNENVRIILMSQKRVMLLVSNPEKQQAMLNITEIKTDQSLYSGRIAKDLAYRMIFDLSNLPDGRYKFKVDFNNKTYEKEIALAGDEFKLINESVYYSPVFYAKDNILTVQHLNPLKEDVSVSFINEFDSFFTDVLPDNVGSFKRDYNLKNLEPGNYSVKLSSGEKKYFHSIDVR